MGSQGDSTIDAQKVAIVGIILGIALSLSPIPTFIDIAIHSKTTGGYTAAPYIASLMCCSMWLTYAIMAGSAKYSMIPLNVVSFVVYLIYCSIYLYFSPDKLRTGKLYMAALAAVAVAVTIGILTKSLIFVGVVATVTNCLMFAAPLMVIHLVIQSRSVRYMPLLLSLSGFLCACTWLLWAVVVEDYFVLIPNALGAFFGLIQLILYAVYWTIELREPVPVSLESLSAQTEVRSEDRTPLKKMSMDEDVVHSHRE
jgi:solute carrier family 50 protein (sugar transporter)